jgi:hypothetical protein
VLLPPTLDNLSIQSIRGVWHGKVYRRDVSLCSVEGCTPKGARRVSLSPAGKLVLDFGFTRKLASVCLPDAFLDMLDLPLMNVEICIDHFV